MSEIRVRYATYEFGEHDIHTRSLRDTNQYEDVGGEAESLGISSAMWPVFGVVWPAGEVLAELMSRRDLDGLRILEVGCGIGVASLVANRRGADITATDRHPRAEEFLQRSTELNDDPEIPFERRAWGEVATDTTLGTFDLIIGSDLLYERGVVDVLADFIDRHAEPVCTVILVDPGRGYMNHMTRAMEARGYAAGRLTVPPDALERLGVKLRTHTYQRGYSAP